MTGGVLALALVAHLTARVQRTSTGPRFPGSLGDPLGDHSAGDADDHEHVGERTHERFIVDMQRFMGRIANGR